jgi:predicted TIM-barrel fold metal-dependent hydrolase
MRTVGGRPDHLLFGTDAPLGPSWGMIEGTIRSIERLAIPDADKEKIFANNAIEIFKLAL